MSGSASEKGSLAAPAVDVVGTRSDQDNCFWACAVTKHDATDPFSLSLKEGEWVWVQMVGSGSQSGWSQGSDERGEKTGWFPNSCAAAFISDPYWAVVEKDCAAQEGCLTLVEGQRIWVQGDGFGEWSEWSYGTDRKGDNAGWFPHDAICYDNDRSSVVDNSSVLESVVDGTAPSHAGNDEGSVVAAGKPPVVPVSSTVVGRVSESVDAGRATRDAAAPAVVIPRATSCGSPDLPFGVRGPVGVSGEIVQVNMMRGEDQLRNQRRMAELLTTAPLDAQGQEEISKRRQASKDRRDEEAREEEKRSAHQSELQALLVQRRNRSAQASVQLDDPASATSRKEPRLPTGRISESTFAMPRTPRSQTRQTQPVLPRPENCVPKADRQAAPSSRGVSPNKEPMSAATRQRLRIPVAPEPRTAVCSELDAVFARRRARSGSNSDPEHEAEAWRRGQATSDATSAGEGNVAPSDGSQCGQKQDVAEESSSTGTSTLVAARRALFDGAARTKGQPVCKVTSVIPFSREDSTASAAAGAPPVEPASLPSAMPRCETLRSGSEEPVHDTRVSQATCKLEMRHVPEQDSVVDTTSCCEFGPEMSEPQAEDTSRTSHKERYDGAQAVEDIFVATGKEPSQAEAEQMDITVKLFPHDVAHDASESGSAIDTSLCSRSVGLRTEPSRLHATKFEPLQSLSGPKGEVDDCAGMETVAADSTPSGSYEVAIVVDFAPCLKTMQTALSQEASEEAVKEGAVKCEADCATKRLSMPLDPEMDEASFLGAGSGDVSAEHQLSESQSECPLPSAPHDVPPSAPQFQPAAFVNGASSSSSIGKTTESSVDDDFQEAVEARAPPSCEFVLTGNAMTFDAAEGSVTHGDELGSASVTLRQDAASISDAVARISSSDSTLDAPTSVEAICATVEYSQHPSAQIHEAVAQAEADGETEQRTRRDMHDVLSTEPQMESELEEMDLEMYVPEDALASGVAWSQVELHHHRVERSQDGRESEPCAVSFLNEPCFVDDVVAAASSCFQPMPVFQEIPVRAEIPMESAVLFVAQNDLSPVPRSTPEPTRSCEDQCTNKLHDRDVDSPVRPAATSSDASLCKDPVVCDASACFQPVSVLLEELPPSTDTDLQIIVPFAAQGDLSVSMFEWNSSKELSSADHEVRTSVAHSAVSEGSAPITHSASIPPCRETPLQPELLPRAGAESFDDVPPVQCEESARQGVVVWGKYVSSECPHDHCIGCDDVSAATKVHEEDFVVPCEAQDAEEEWALESVEVWDASVPEDHAESSAWDYVHENLRDVLSAAAHTESKSPLASSEDADDDFELEEENTLELLTECLLRPWTGALPQCPHPSGSEVEGQAAARSMIAVLDAVLSSRGRGIRSVSQRNDDVLSLSEQRPVPPTFASPGDPAEVLFEVSPAPDVFDLFDCRDGVDVVDCAVPVGLREFSCWQLHHPSSPDSEEVALGAEETRYLGTHFHDCSSDFSLSEHESLASVLLHSGNRSTNSQCFGVHPSAEEYADPMYTGSLQLPLDRIPVGKQCSDAVVVCSASEGTAWTPTSSDVTCAPQDSPQDSVARGRPPVLPQATRASSIQARSSNREVSQAAGANSVSPSSDEESCQADYARRGDDASFTSRSAHVAGYCSGVEDAVKSISWSLRHEPFHALPPGSTSESHCVVSVSSSMGSTEECHWTSVEPETSRHLHRVLTTPSASLSSDAVATDIESSRTGAWWASGDMDESRLEIGTHIPRHLSDKRRRDAEYEAVLAWREARARDDESDETPREPIYPSEASSSTCGPGPSAPSFDVCHAVTSSLAGQTCAVSCVLPPVESVLTSVDTPTQRRECVASDVPPTTRSSHALHRLAQESCWQPTSWVGFSSPVTPSLTSRSLATTSPAIALANGGASLALTGQDEEDNVTALPDPWCTVAALVVSGTDGAPEEQLSQGAKERSRPEALSDVSTTMPDGSRSHAFSADSAMSSTFEVDTVRRVSDETPPSTESADDAPSEAEVQSFRPPRASREDGVVLKADLLPIVRREYEDSDLESEHATAIMGCSHDEEQGDDDSREDAFCAFDVPYVACDLADDVFGLIPADALGEQEHFSDGTATVVVNSRAACGDETPRHRSPPHKCVGSATMLPAGAVAVEIQRSSGDETLRRRCRHATSSDAGEVATSAGERRPGGDETPRHCSSVHKFHRVLHSTTCVGGVPPCRVESSSEMWRLSGDETPRHHAHRVAHRPSDFRDADGFQERPCTSKIELPRLPPRPVCASPASACGSLSDIDLGDRTGSFSEEPEQRSTLPVVGSAPSDIDSVEREASDTDLTEATRRATTWSELYSVLSRRRARSGSGASSERTRLDAPISSLPQGQCISKGTSSTELAMEMDLKRLSLPALQEPPVQVPREPSRVPQEMYEGGVADDDETRALQYTTETELEIASVTPVSSHEIVEDFLQLGRESRALSRAPSTASFKSCEPDGEPPCFPEGFLSCGEGLREWQPSVRNVVPELFQHLEMSENALSAGEGPLNSAVERSDQDWQRMSFSNSVPRTRSEGGSPKSLSSCYTASLQEDDIDEDEELMFVGEASPSSISSELVFMGEALSPRTLQDLAESGVDISLVEEKPPVAGKNTPDDATRRFNSAEAGHCASTRAAPLSDAPFQDVSPTGNDFSTRFDPRETTPRGRLGGPSNRRLTPRVAPPSGDEDDICVPVTQAAEIHLPPVSSPVFDGTCAAEPCACQCTIC